MLADPVLPAAAELVGEASFDLLAPAVSAAGGTLDNARCVGVHYVPGRELVARYDCAVTWPAGSARETLLAGTTVYGELPSTVPVTAETPETTLRAGVWRWPFDPVVTGLSVAATPGQLAPILAPVTGGGSLAVEVVAYRPTERAVLRITDVNDRVFYLKAVPPARLVGVLARHEALLAVGVPVPRILLADEERGLVLMEAMPGVTLRQRIKELSAVWPEPAALSELLDRIGLASGLDAGRSCRTRDAIAHADLLKVIVPEASVAVDELRRRLASSMKAAVARKGRGPSAVVVHGDLHEAQLFIDDEGRIVGIIDLDDLGPGDPLDDPAVLLGHLEYRALTNHSDVARCIAPAMSQLWTHFGERWGSEALHHTVGAVLVGLATGPYRSQAAGWREVTVRLIESAAAHLDTEGGRA